MVVFDNGRILKDILDGKAFDGSDLAMFKDNGSYLVSNSIGLPVGVLKESQLLLKVSVVGNIVWQTLYDHVGENVYVRTISPSGLSRWLDFGGSSVENVIKSINSEIEAFKKNDATQDTSIKDMAKSLSDIKKVMGDEMKSHNHDERYMKIDGTGLATASLRAENEFGLNLTTNNNNVVNGITMDGTNKINVGDKLGDMVLRSKGEIMVSNVEGNHTLLHTGSSVNASKFGNKAIESFALKDGINEFTNIQTIKGSTLTMKDSKVEHRASNGTLLGKSYMSASGIFTVDNALGQPFFYTGETGTSIGGGLTVDGNIPTLQLKRGSADKGVEFSAYTGQVNFTDLKSDKIAFALDRASNVMQFTNAIKVQNHKVSVQPSAPTSPVAGDIWIW